jgi:hypothetical protein
MATKHRVKPRIRGYYKAAQTYPRRSERRARGKMPVRGVIPLFDAVIAAHEEEEKVKRKEEYKKRRAVKEEDEEPRKRKKKEEIEHEIPEKRKPRKYNL